LVGMSDLQARSAYQPTIHKQGERYIAYIGHHGGTPDVPKPMNKLTGQAEFNGTSILDVTDPANPKYLKHIPGLEGTYDEGGVQILDREKLINGAKEPTPDNLRAPVVGELQMSPLVGAHTVYPLGEVAIPQFAGDKFGAKRNMLMIVDESLVNECGTGESRQMVWLVDMTIEKLPMVVANYTPD